MSEQALIKSETRSLMERDAWSPKEVIMQIKAIQELMSRAMRENEHYGIIPGCQKPTLYKSGAEKLGMMFRLCPEYEELPGSIETEDFIHYKIRCVLYHIPTGRKMGSGLGSCNSRETKYRYRWVETDEKPDKKTAQKLKADNVGKWRKNEKGWVWLRRIENPDIWDIANTIYKMACIRALKYAILNVTAASDVFTQDIEDLPEFEQEIEESIIQEPTEEYQDIPQETKPKRGRPAKKETPTKEEPNNDKLTPSQKVKLIGDILMKLGGGRKESARDLLQECSKFEGEDGKLFSVRSLVGLEQNEKWLNVILGRAKEMLIEKYGDNTYIEFKEMVKTNM